MKRNVICIAAVLFITVGCQKEVIETNEINTELQVIENESLETHNKEFVNPIDDLTNTYIRSIDVNEERKDGKWRKIIGKDLVGFVTGAGIGAGVGAVVGGIGAGPGALIGGVLMGAGASLAASNGSNGGSNGTGIGNSNNPYEGTGVAHYDVVTDGLNGSNYFNGTEITDYQAYYTKVFSVLKIKYQDCDNGISCFNVIDVQNVIEEVSSGNKNLVASLNNVNGISQNVKTVLHSYFNGIMNSNNSTPFINYSIDAENVILNSSMNNLDKTIILSTMANARIGVQFWNPNM